jgi:hypothetical protein
MGAAMVDKRLQSYWQREQEARARARAALPASWRNDPRPAMADVREVYIEGMVSLRRATALPADDR